VSLLCLKRIVLNLLIGISAGFILLVLLVRLLENRFIYFPPRYPRGFSEPEDFGLYVQEVWLTTQDTVRLNAFFLRNESSPKVLLWFHGNAENIGHGLGQLAAFSRLAVNVFAVDYRGYGKSGGRPDEAGVYLDADAAYDYLLEAARFRPENIIIFGHSLGGAVAIDLASRRKCGALIVESSISNAREMTRRMFRIPLFEYLPKTRFDSVRKIRSVQAPILIIHGKQDEVVPFSMGKKLFEAAPEPKSFYAIDGAGHNDVLDLAGQDYLMRLKSFIERGV
jgi:fermentation-respiration switch protein FrsA (DUF1100 family)